MHGHIRTRRERIFNIVGFVSIALFVVGGTIVLVMVAKGYNFDFKTKEVVQNGLILVNSEPVSAQVYMDDKSLDETTPHRLTVPAGQHVVNLVREGFREWRRSFDLSPGEVLWLSYPLLLPDSLAPREVAQIGEKPVAEGSPDSSLLAVANGQTITIYESEQSTAAITIDLAARVDGLNGSVRSLEWADNNKHLLAAIGDGSSERIVLMTAEEEPEIIDITDATTGYSDLQFVPGETGFIYGLKDNALWQLSVDGSPSPERLVEEADRFAAFESAIITWSSNSRRVALHQADRHTVLDIPPVNQLLDMALSEHDSQLIAAVSSEEHGTTVIIAPGEAGQRIVSHQRAGSRMVFSPGAGYLMSHKDGTFQVYDFERRRFYAYELPVESLTDVRWATGAHLLAIADGKQAMLFDFDGQNLQKISDAVSGVVILSPDQEHVLHIGASSADKQKTLVDTDLQPNN